MAVPARAMPRIMGVSLSVSVARRRSVPAREEDGGVGCGCCASRAVAEREPCRCGEGAVLRRLRGWIAAAALASWSALPPAPPPLACFDAAGVRPSSL